ncbi:MAG TPA: pur operon repressor [Verrucomicrobiae bacterium]|nr:pur operon repressor [Verrucomicrobiae bacterium]
MEKYKRSERLVAITNYLTDHPGELISLGSFSELFSAAKSTISEDLVIIRDTLERFQQGSLETLPGAAGGVRFLPGMGHAETQQFLLDLAEMLSKPERIIPGGFLYMTDLLFNPVLSSRVGTIFAAKFADLAPDCVITIETKGIPLALMTAKALNVPLVVIRNDSKVTEGSSVSINYVSGSTRRILTMSLPRRSLVKGARVVVIDDFMKAGGTAKGMLELLEEFDTQVLGVGVLISTLEPKEKLVHEYVSLLELVEMNEQQRKISIQPTV